MNEIFIWQHRHSPKKTFEQLENIFIGDRIIQEFNNVQRNSLTKFNIFYSLCFMYSSKLLSNISSRGGIISHEDPLPRNGVMSDFDKYFKRETKELYKAITIEGSGTENVSEGANPA